MPSLFVTRLNVDLNAYVNPLGNYLDTVNLCHTYAPMLRLKQETRDCIIY